MGIEPTSKAWEALILPMNYARLLLKSSKQRTRSNVLMIWSFSPRSYVTLSQIQISFSKHGNFNISLIVRQEKNFS